MIVITAVLMVLEYIHAETIRKEGGNQALRNIRGKFLVREA